MRFFKKKNATHVVIPFVIDYLIKKELMAHAHELRKRELKDYLINMFRGRMDKPLFDKTSWWKVANEVKNYDMGIT